MELSSIIFAIALFFLGFFFNKYFLLFLSKNNFQSLVDNQFDKPHESAPYVQ